MKLFVLLFITYLVQCRGEERSVGSVRGTDTESAVDQLYKPILPTGTGMEDNAEGPDDVEYVDEFDDPVVQLTSENGKKFHVHQFYSDAIKHKSKKLPTTMFEKVKQMQEPVYDTACPKILSPACAITNGTLTVYSNNCVLMKLKNEDPSKEYRSISNECCATYWKYCTQPALNIS